MRIAIFDYKTTSNNPTGNCHLKMLEGLCNEHEFTVFSAEFENPCPGRIKYVHIPVPRRPLAALFIMFHLVAPVLYLYHKWFGLQGRFELMQVVESNLFMGDLSYTHFCHRSFLRREAPKGSLRSQLRRVNNWLHAVTEPWVYRRVRRIVVPSKGLLRDLEKEYPSTKGKIDVIPNSVDIEERRMPDDFRRQEFRHGLSLVPRDFVLLFAALGHFERKGLPLVLEALRQLQKEDVKLLVVGGRKQTVDEYRGRARKMGVARNVTFVGLQEDVRPYFWSADCFVLPSLYEAFPLVALEAAASGLPIIATPVNGVEDFLDDGINGIEVRPEQGSIATGIHRVATMDPNQKRSMGEEARRSIRIYSPDRFVASWRYQYEFFSHRKD